MDKFKLSDKQLKKIRTNYVYDNMKDVCNDLGIDFNDVSGGRQRELLYNEIEKMYDIEKVSRYKIKFTGKSLSKLRVEENENKIKDGLKGNSNISKIFQALLANYLSEAREVRKTRIHYMSMGEIVNKLDIVGDEHRRFNTKRDKKVMIKSAKSPDDVDVIEYAFDNWEEKHFKEYYNRYYNNGYQLYKRALDNLQKIGVIQYIKGHQMTYKVLTMKGDTIFDTNTYKHKFAHKEKRDAIFNGQWKAWLYMRDRFNLKSNPSKNDFNANTSELFSSYNNSFRNIKEYYENIKQDIKSDNNELYRYELDAVNSFKYNKEMSFYDLFKKYACWFIAREMEEYMGKNKKVEVEYYYNAYEIITKDLAIEVYSKNVMNEIALEYNKKEEQLNYMLKGFVKNNNKNDIVKLGELAYFLINDKRLDYKHLNKQK